MVPGLADNLAALHIVRFNAAQQQANVVAGLPSSRIFGTSQRRCRSSCGVANTDDLNFLADLDLAALDTASGNGAAAGDREDVLDGHQERLVDVALGLGDVVVQGVDQFVDALCFVCVGVIGFQRLERAAADDRNVVAGELVLAEQLADFLLHQLESSSSSTRSTLFRKTTM